VFRRIEDFVRAWSRESEATLKVFRALTDESLSRAVAPGGRTLGRLAWHITICHREMMGHAGLAIEGPAEDASPPPLAEILRQYEASARDVGAQVARQWTDALLAESIPMYGEQWTRGETLAALLVHEVHHRAQMTVLMRQAGLKVPGVYGPAAEEWAALGMPAQA
jgi:uncharacterized damage-inducible protein DinB